MAGLGRVFQGVGAVAAWAWLWRGILLGIPRHRVWSNAARSGVHALT
ncbi:hypothetical protein HMPREF9004_0519 [Schaalia cardiffensis F0333]|uniref:Uncharacterized protein n=1 Tax=Schaalia cardiffensis F0333 TaxID=888050 RepID=N6WF20_9ACTO|nr:hypothetical protein HMPREF9004_0519 [Schaalia cardiffensis F0333]